MSTIREAAVRAAAAVDGERLWRRLVELSRHGGFGERGVNRQAFSAEDLAARRTLLDWAAEAGLEARTDPAGNLFLRWTPPEAENGAAAVLTGSHVDSQPLGGRYDGAYGVLAGLEALLAVKTAAPPLRRPLEVVAWSNEEGSRFQPGLTGSGWVTGKLDLETIRAGVDAAGTTCGAALDAFLAGTPGLPERPREEPIHAYLEAHIEQGPLLEAEGLLAAAVDAVQGIKWFEILVSGRAAHAGTTPIAHRADAFVTAAALASELRALALDTEDTTRFTIGRFEVVPGSPNTVPEKVLFTIDLRHPDAARLAALAEAFAEACARAEQAGPCGVSIRVTSDAPPITFEPALVQRIEDNLERLGLPRFRMRSGAGHDAMLLAGRTPTAMVFIACEAGVSHNPQEYATPEAVTAGARVLAATLAELGLDRS